jgi:hypothetical protein
LLRTRLLGVALQNKKGILRFSGENPVVALFQRRSQRCRTPNQAAELWIGASGMFIGVAYSSIGIGRFASAHESAHEFAIRHLHDFLLVIVSGEKFLNLIPQ